MKPRRLLQAEVGARSRSASQAPPEWMPTMAASRHACQGRCAPGAATRGTALRRRTAQLGVGMVVKVLLQDDGGGFRVDDLAALGLDHGRRIALVDQLDRQIEAAVQLVGEAAAAHRHLVLGAVRVARLADHQAGRAPLGDQLADLREAGGIVDRLDHVQRLRLAGQGVAHGDADALDAEVESEDDLDHASQVSHYAWPASEASIIGSMPSSLMAAL